MKIEHPEAGMTPNVPRVEDPLPTDKLRDGASPLAATDPVARQIIDGLNQAQGHYRRSQILAEMLKLWGKSKDGNTELNNAVVSLGVLAESGADYCRLSRELIEVTTDLSNINAYAHKFYPETVAGVLANKPNVTSAELLTRVLSLVTMAQYNNGLFNWKGRIIRLLMGVK